MDLGGGAVSGLVGRVALVTGGGRGIGRVIATTLAADGAAVAVTGRDPSALERVVAVLRADGARACGVVADVGVETDVARLVEQVTRELGVVDVLVNNAAAAGPTLPVTEMPLSAFVAVLQTNLVGPFLLSRAVIPGMALRGAGAIVNVGSIAGIEAYPLRSPYAASKWGLEGLTRTLAAEVGPDGIRVNLVAPGPTEGDRAEGVIAARAESTGVDASMLRAEYEQRIPLRRFVTPDEVAQAVAFLAGDAASGITGQSFRVSGGIEI